MKNFPFTAVVGQERLKLALLLNAIDPRIGGVLIRGDKGSGKTTLARALGELLTEGSPFIEVPAGATEDRVKGSVDLEAMVDTGALEVRSGLLSDADGGVLYVDEVNLLPDHIIDLLLDSAATGVNRIERDGISAVLGARYVLVGSMNPEEGELRPQLLDRFGFSIESETIISVSDRVAAVMRRLQFDADPADFCARFEDEQQVLRTRLTTARLAGSLRADGLLASLPENVLRVIVELCMSYKVQGLRADLTLARASAAHRALLGGGEVTFEDIKAVAPLVLAHRARSDPSRSSSQDLMSTEDAIEQLRLDDDERKSGHEADGGATAEMSEQSGSCGGDEAGSKGAGAGPTLTLGAGEARIFDRSRNNSRSDAQINRLGGGGLGAASIGRRGPGINDDDQMGKTLDVVATVAKAASRRANGNSATSSNFIERQDVVLSKKLSKHGITIFVALDLSGSIGSPLRIELTSIVTESLLVDAYQNRDQVSLIVICEGRARVLQKPTGSVEIIRAKLAGISAGGITPLAEGIDLLYEEAMSAVRRGENPFLILITDGRATGSPRAFEDAQLSARRIATSGLPSCVIDVENSPVPLRLAGELADSMAGELIDHGHVEDLAANSALRDRLLRL